MRLEEELKCNGLMGFGTGYVLGQSNEKMSYKVNGKDSYCAWSCPLARECWNRHQVKVRLMMPRATKMIDAMCHKYGQEIAMHVWKANAEEINNRYPHMLDKLPEQDPYLLQMNANIQDGYSFAKIGKVVDRGGFTLKYPID